MEPETIAAISMAGAVGVVLLGFAVRLGVMAYRQEK